MINKIFLSIFVFLATFSNIYAYAGDPKVFQFSYDNDQIACAEIGQESAYCWHPTKAKFLKLKIEQSERKRMRSISSASCDQSNSKLYISKLEELSVQILNYNNYDSKYERNRRAKIRALGATIYINHGHDEMVYICDSLQRSRGIRRLVESYWNLIGDWLG